MMIELLKKWFSECRDRDRSPNAPVDPFRNLALSAGELASRFALLRADWVLSRADPFPKHETLFENEREAFFSADKPPKAVIFVSHRWESLTQPDASGRQADAVRYFLRMVAGIHRQAALSNGLAEMGIPSLYVHGVLQAAYFYDSGIRFCRKSKKRWDRRTRPDLLESIGIFYDYTSLPQDGISSRLVEALGTLHTLIGESTMLILRAPGDNYENRAWCALELSVDPEIERKHCDKIVLRMDKIGAPIREHELLPKPSSGFYGLRKTRIERNHEWPAQPSVALQDISGHYFFGMSELEELQETPCFTTKPNPSRFPGQSLLLVSMIRKLGHFSRIDHSSNSVNFDLVSVVVEALIEAGLQTSNEGDFAYTGLLILYSRSRGAPAMARFYANCLKRLLANQSTTVVRYREHRTLREIKAWYIFSDEAFDSIGVPNWA